MPKEITLPRATGAGRPEEHNCNIAIYGDHGGGKTTWVEEVLLRNKERLIIIDTLCKDYGKPEVCKALNLHYDKIVTDVNEGLQFIAQKVGKDGKGKFRVIFRCPGKEMQVMKLFEFDQAKQRSILTDTTVLVEEITFFMDSNNIEPELKSHLQYGRHNRNNLIGVAQVPRGQTHPLYRSQMDMFISFRQTADSAIRFFADFSTEKAERLRTLERGEYELFSGTPQELLEFIEQP